MSDDPIDPELEARVRESFNAADLPPAPAVLLERAAQLARSGSGKGRPGRMGLSVVLLAVIGIVAVNVFTIASHRPPVGGSSSSPASGSTDATPSSPGREDPTAIPPTATPTLRPFPVDRPEPSAPAVDPAPDDDLALAGHGDVPGLLDCGFGLPFRVDALQNPMGAEDLSGPEYDALQDLMDRYVALGASELGPDPTAREVAHDATSAMFLVDHAGSGSGGGFPFVPISIDMVDRRWEGSYGVDCQPERSFLRVTNEPHGRSTQRIRLPQRKRAPYTFSSRSTPARVADRRPVEIGPAYVVVSRFEMAIEIIVKKRPGDQECQGAPRVKARLSLPETIKGRFLRDVNDYLHNQSGG